MILQFVTNGAGMSFWLELVSIVLPVFVGLGLVLLKSVMRGRSYRGSER
jgi:hypothetical protein